MTSGSFHFFFQLILDVARLTCAEADICLCLSLAVVIDCFEADVICLTTLQLRQFTLEPISLT